MKNGLQTTMLNAKCNGLTPFPQSTPKAGLSGKKDNILPVVGSRDDARVTYRQYEPPFPHTHTPLLHLKFHKILCI